MATTAQLLTEARSVYHDWRLGKIARSYTDANGERVEYSAEGLRGLAAYIADLERLLAIENGTPATNKPLRVFF